MFKTSHKIISARIGDFTEINIQLIKPTRCTNFSNLFWNGTLYVSNNSLVYYQEFFTVHTAMVYVIQVCRQLSSRIRNVLIRICHTAFEQDQDGTS